jgi:hypothetical protein
MTAGDLTYRSANLVEIGVLDIAEERERDMQEVG